MSSDEAAARAGQLLGASHVVTGNIYLDPLTARLDVRLVDVASAQPTRPPLKKSGTHDQLSALVDQLATEFARDLGFGAKSTERLHKNGASPSRPLQARSGDR